MIYGSWDMEYDRDKVFVILGHFLPFYPTNNPKNQNFLKNTKLARDITILHKCSESYDYMLHCSWDIARERCSFYFRFWDIFCPFTPLAALEAWSFYTCLPKIMIRWCTVPEIWCGMNGRTNGLEKWHVGVGSPPKNIYLCLNIVEN